MFRSKLTALDEFDSRSGFSVEDGRRELPTAHAIAVGVITPMVALRASLRRFLPAPILRAKETLLGISQLVLAYYGTEIFDCPNCGRAGRFRAVGDPPRFNACCSHCGSRERHRLFRRMLDVRPELVAGRKILHFAPEDCLSDAIQSLSGEYVSGDLVRHRAQRVLNVEHLAESDESYDVVIACHLLEHVEDGSALANIHRVLRPGGHALLMMPVVEGWDETYEDCTVQGAAGRRRHFGQHDHLRYYGRDVRERIRAAGFDLEEFTALAPDVMRYSLLRGDKVFIARKPSTR